MVDLRCQLTDTPPSLFGPIHNLPTPSSLSTQNTQNMTVSSQPDIDLWDLNALQLNTNDSAFVNDTAHWVSISHQARVLTLISIQDIFAPSNFSANTVDGWEDLTKSNGTYS